MSDHREAGPPERETGGPVTAGLKVFDGVVKGGPWALICVIVLVVLGGEYGLFSSQTRRNADAVETLVRQTAGQHASLEKIVGILEEQRRIQAQAALIACFKEAKWDSDRAECIKKFPIK